MVNIEKHDSPILARLVDAVQRSPCTTTNRVYLVSSLIGSPSISVIFASCVGLVPRARSLDLTCFPRHFTRKQKQLTTITNQ